MGVSVRRVSNCSQQVLLRGETLSLTPKNAQNTAFGVHDVAI